MCANYDDVNDDDDDVDGGDDGDDDDKAEESLTENETNLAVATRNVILLIPFIGIIHSCSRRRRICLC